MRGPTRSAAVAAMALVCTLLSAGCSGSAAPTGTTASTSSSPAATSASPSAVPQPVLAGLCKLVIPAVRASTKYYDHTDFQKVDTVADMGYALLRGQSDASIYADDIATAYTKWRLSLVHGYDATLKAFTHWHDVCVARGFPLV